MGIRLDSVINSTLHESYQNYKTVQSADIVISGTLPASGQKYTDTVTLDRDRTRADVYYTSDYSGVQNRLVCANEAVNNQLFQPTASTTQSASTVIEYSGNDLEVGLFISNTSGGNESLTTQTLKFYIIQYHAPITAL